MLCSSNRNAQTILGRITPAELYTFTIAEAHGALSETIIAHPTAVQAA